MKKCPVTVVIAGIGGYGYCYLQELWSTYTPDQVRLAGVVDPAAEASAHISRINAEGIPVFEDMESFYAAGLTADLAVIVSPIHCHVPQSITALQRGSRVLCDKPLSATVREADELMAAEKAAGSPVMVGYQWSYSQAVQTLKQDIISGRYGKPLRAKAICLWPRGFDYYSRNTWAGKVKTASGTPVFDSPANNAAAHFLHNLLFLLGASQKESVSPLRAAADLFRAYPIENFDTVACRIAAHRCPEVLFYASHATRETVDPHFEIELERGTVSFPDTHGNITAEKRDGGKMMYGNPDTDQFKKLHDAVSAVHKTADPLCGTEAAKAQTIAVGLIQEHPVREIEPRLVKKEHRENRLYVEGLGKTLLDCYYSNSLLSEKGVPPFQGVY